MSEVEREARADVVDEICQHYDVGMVYCDGWCGLLCHGANAEITGSQERYNGL